MQVTQLYEVTYETPDNAAFDTEAAVLDAIEEIPGVISAKLYTPADGT